MPKLKTTRTNAWTSEVHISIVKWKPTNLNIRSMMAALLLRRSQNKHNIARAVDTQKW